VVVLALCGAVASAEGYVGARHSGAESARTTSMSDLGHLHLVSHHAERLVEHGTVSGTFGCSLAVYLDISYTEATFTFSCRNGGSALTGRGKTSYYAKGATAKFSGTLTIRGTGRYRRVSGAGVSVTGTMQRPSYALTIAIHGKINE
jgi:hypothetical protein